LHVFVNNVGNVIWTCKLIWSQTGCSKCIPSTRPVFSIPITMSNPGLGLESLEPEWDSAICVSGSSYLVENVRLRNHVNVSF
jgi:hypothetical protein